MPSVCIPATPSRSEHFSALNALLKKPLPTPMNSCWCFRWILGESKAKSNSRFLPISITRPCQEVVTISMRSSIQTELSMLRLISNPQSPFFPINTPNTQMTRIHSSRPIFWIFPRMQEYLPPTYLKCLPWVSRLRLKTLTWCSHPISFRT